MVFKKNDPKTKELSSKGHQAYRENKEQNNKMLVEAITGGFKPYEDKMKKIEQGLELTPAEKEYMDRIEKWVEFAIPKLARTEVKAEVTGSLFGKGHAELGDNS